MNNGRWHVAKDQPINVHRGKDGGVYMVVGAGIGQAMVDDEQAVWVVTLAAVNAQGDEITVMLGDSDLEMIRHADQMRSEGFS